MSDNKKIELSLIVSISELILKHGVPMALQLMKDWEVTDPTIEDIQQLKNRVPKPSSYFEVELDDEYDYNSSIEDI